MSYRDPAMILDDISRERIPADLNLAPGALAKIQHARQDARKRAMRLRAAAVLLILAVLIILFTRPGVVSALKNLIGYVPGFGPVEQSAPLRALASPVTETRAGYALTVQSAVLDASRTVINLEIAGAFPSWPEPSQRPATCQAYPILRLEDGKALAYTSSELGLGGGKAQWQLVFSAMPASESGAVLVLPCLADLPDGQGPQNWEIALAFVPAPPEMTVYPVIDLPTAQPGQPENQALGNADGTNLAIQGVAALDEGYYLQAVLSWPADPGAYNLQVFPDAIHLVDAAGEEVPVWPGGQAPPPAAAGERALRLDLQTGPVRAAGPARLVVDYVAASLPADASFSFDAGDDPRPGQTWILNKDLDVAGYPLRVLSAEYARTPPGEPVMLLLRLEAGAEVLTVTAMDEEHAILGTSGAPNTPQAGFQAGWHYKDGFPKGTITVHVTSITLRRSGPWSAEWTPAAPAATPGAPAAAAPQAPAACANEIMLQAAAGALPIDLRGRVISSALTGDGNALYVSNLDGSQRVALGSGALADLSPDGRRVVYLGADDGLHVRDLASGSDALIPGTLHPAGLDDWPRWSPDGGQIVFNRITDRVSDVFLVNPDGSNLRAVVSGPEDERLLGWSPDGKFITYLVRGASQHSIRVLDLQAGRSFEAAQLPGEALTVSLSPDGKRLVYITMHGLYLAVLGQPGPVLLVASSPTFGNQIHPIWSPDGRWIAITYWEAGNDGLPGVALLQPDSCQVVFLPGLKGGWLTSWAPSR